MRTAGRIVLVVAGALLAAATAGCGSSSLPSLSQGSSASSSVTGSVSSSRSSGSSSSSTATSTGSASGGQKLDNGKFTVTVPSGWEDHSQDSAEIAKLNITGQSLLLVELPPFGTLVTNVNDVTAVVQCDIPKDSPISPDQWAAYLKSVEGNGPTNVSATKSLTVGLEQGLYETYDQDISGTPGTTLDLVVNHEGVTYNFGFTTSRADFPDVFSGQVTPILQSWKWDA